MNQLFKITYTNILTGERQSYMNVGFESECQARAELDRLIRDKNKSGHLYTEEKIRQLYEGNFYLPTYAIAEDWKIEPIKLSKKHHEIKHTGLKQPPDRHIHGR